jgi:hypothetical protein
VAGARDIERRVVDGLWERHGGSLGVITGPARMRRDPVIQLIS